MYSNVGTPEAEARARKCEMYEYLEWNPAETQVLNLDNGHGFDIITGCDCGYSPIRSYNDPRSTTEHSLPHIMAIKGTALKEYHDQQHSQAEHPEDIPLNDLNHQYPSQPLYQPDDHDDNDDEDDRSSVQSFELYTPDEEKSLLRKLDTRLVVCLAFLYMLSFLDRSSMPITIQTSRSEAEKFRHWQR